MRSISSMIRFISRIAALNGSEVVMSTPASCSSSIGYFDEPAYIRRRYASRFRCALPDFTASLPIMPSASDIPPIMLVAYW